MAIFRHSLRFKRLTINPKQPRRNPFSDLPEMRGQFCPAPQSQLLAVINSPPARKPYNFFSRLRIRPSVSTARQVAQNGDRVPFQDSILLSSSAATGSMLPTKKLGMFFRQEQEGLWSSRT